MSDVFIYVVQMPTDVKSFVTPCQDGFTIYINSILDSESARRALEHELRHIAEDDFSGINVAEIECRTHSGN